MGKVNMFTVLTVTVLQFIVGYLWYGTYLFGDVVTASGHDINFLKLDVISLLLIVLSSYGLTYLMDLLLKTSGTKDVGGGVKLGLTVGSFGIGLPILMLLNLMGFGKVMLLVVFCHIVLLTILTNVVIVKLKKI